MRALMMPACWCHGSEWSAALLAPQAVSEQSGSRVPPSPLRSYFSLNSSSDMPSRSPFSSYNCCSVFDTTDDEAWLAPRQVSLGKSC